LPEEEGAPEWIDARGHKEAWADALRPQAEGVEPAAFANIPCPAVRRHGANDPRPDQATQRRLRRFVPHLEYRPFPRCGRKPWVERRACQPFLRAPGDWPARA
jgi:pimeloyl-ACP methyl ester carboxylesterase